MQFTLEISRLPGAIAATAGRGAVGVIRGGPDELLRWLEEQLGLGPPRDHAAFHRIAQHARWIDAAAPAEFAESVAADRWQTAAALLRRRDDLRMGGWNGGPIDVDIPAVRAIVAVEAAAGAAGDNAGHGRGGHAADGGIVAERHAEHALSGDAERLDEVVAALDAGQVLPAHRLYLLERAEQWPWRWRQLLDRLDVDESRTDVTVHRTKEAPEDAALWRVLQAVVSGQVVDVEQDASLVWIESASDMSAVELIAAMLANEGASGAGDHGRGQPCYGRGGVLANEARSGAETVVACADPILRLRLEHRFAALDLPTAGVTAQTQQSPAFQVLPLTIELCQRRVSPERLLDFLQLPVSPLPRGPARRLARALAEHPGLGSERWVQVWNEVCSPQADPDGSVRTLLQRWLPDHESAAQACDAAGTGATRGASAADSDQQDWNDDGLRIDMVLERCLMVAAWSSDESKRIAAQRPENPSPLSTVLRAAAEQAEMLAELLQDELDCSSGARTISWPQWRQWMRASHDCRRTLSSFEHQMGAVRIVASPAEIRDTVDRLIWVSGWEATHPVAPWSMCEVDALRGVGIQLDLPTHAADARTRRQRAGVAWTRRGCILVRLPARDEWSESGVWAHIEACLAGPERCRQASRLCDIVDGLHSFTAEGGHATGRQPRPCDIAEGIAAHPVFNIVPRAFDREPTQPIRPQWRVGHASLQPSSRSATEMTEHLACPLRWVLRRVARVAPAGNARLPGQYQLAGTFCHQVLRRAFKGTTTIGSPAEARRRVLEVFDQRVGQDAAVLAKPASAPARGRLREQLGRATERLAGVLQAGGYTHAALEVPFDIPDFSTTSDDEGDVVLMRGVIDCLAVHEDGSELVIDFKFGGDTRRREAIRQGRAVQLATYAYSRFHATGRYPAVAYLVLSTAQIYTPRDSRPLGMPAAECETGPPIESVWTAFAEALTGASAWTRGNEPTPCRPLQPMNHWPPRTDLVLDLPQASGDSLQVQSFCRYCDYGLLCGRISLE